MNRLRFWVFVLALWLIVLVASAPLLVPLSAQTGLLGFVVLALVLPIFFPSREMWPKWVLLAGLMGMYMVLQVYRSGGINLERDLSTTTTLALAVIATGFIASRIGVSLQNVEETISEIALSDATATPTSFSDAQVIMYRELQRARYFERPLSIVIARVDADSMKATVPKVTQEVQETLVRKFVLTKVAEVLDENLPQFDPVALRDNSFIAILPEATPTEATAMAKSIGDAVESRLGIKLCLGTASLPFDAQTFEALVEIAEEKSNCAPPTHSSGGQYRQKAEESEFEHRNGSTYSDAPGPETDESVSPTPEHRLKHEFENGIPSRD